MRAEVILIFFFAFVFAHAHPEDGGNEIKIDTIKVTFRIKDIADITSYVPQIKNGVNDIAKGNINADLKKYFQATSVTLDSAKYVSELLEHFNVKTIQEYFEAKKVLAQGSPYFKEGNPYYYGDQLEEGFCVEYLSENLLNISISTHLLPNGGQPSFFFKSVMYNLTSGSKYDFDDFIFIDKQTLLSVFKKQGYSVSWLSDPDKPFEIAAIDTSDEYVDKCLQDLFVENDRCVEFYFSRKGNETHLMFKLLCAGPQLLDYGISLNKLLPYLKYYEFKNEYKLWGSDINSIKGLDYLTLGNKMEFDNYSAVNSGSGYLLATDNELSNHQFGIATCHSSKSVFYLFLKYQTISNHSKAIISDILEIQKTDLSTDKKVTEYCETKKGADVEILAIVSCHKNNPEYYRKIIKAWRANRKTERFEPFNRKKVKKCGNESYGI